MLLQFEPSYKLLVVRQSSFKRFKKTRFFRKTGFLVNYNRAKLI